MSLEERRRRRRQQEAGSEDVGAGRPDAGDGGSAEPAVAAGAPGTLDLLRRLLESLQGAAARDGFAERLATNSPASLAQSIMSLTRALEVQDQAVEAGRPLVVETRFPGVGASPEDFDKYMVAEQNVALAHQVEKLERRLADLESAGKAAGPVVPAGGGGSSRGLVSPTPPAAAPAPKPTPAAPVEKWKPTWGRCSACGHKFFADRNPPTACPSCGTELDTPDEPAEPDRPAGGAGLNVSVDDSSGPGWQPIDSLDDVRRLFGGGG